MKTAVIYTRVSTDEQAKSGLSLEFQEDVIRKYCAINDIQILKHFQDGGKSAKNTQREEFKKMFEYTDRHHHTVDFVLFSKWSRFSRNATDSLNMIRTLQDLGIQPQAVQQPLDLSIPQNKLMLAFYIMEPEVNNDVRSIATLEALRRIRLKGGWTGGAPMGYDHTRTPEGNPTLKPGNRAFLIRKAYEMIREGKTQKEVRRVLRANGYVAGKDYIKHILSNQAYLGLVFVAGYKKEPARWVQGLHPAIIDSELFQDVQRVLRGSAPKGNRYKNTPELPLRRHLRCKRCGNKLTRSGSKNRIGKKYYYYHCQNGCKERIPAHEANEAFLRYLKTIQPRKEVVKLYEAIMIDIFSEKQGTSEDRLVQIEKEIVACDEKLMRADEMYIDGKMPQQRYEQFTTKFTARKAELADQRKDVKEIDSNMREYLEFAGRLVQNLHSFYMAADPALRSQLLCSIFPNQVIYIGNGEYRTQGANGIIELFCGLEADFEAAKSNKLAISDQLVKLRSPNGTEVERVSPVNNRV